MPRKLTIAAAQVGAVHLTSPRKETLDRLLTLLNTAASKGAKLVLFPETTLTTFFPRHLFHDQTELDKFFEHAEDITTSPNVAPLFARAKELGVDISVGYAERTADGRGFNTCVYYSASQDKVLSKYRKVHLPGTKEPFEDPEAINQLEKRYFEPGDLGFKAFRAPNLLPDVLKKKDVEEGENTVGKGDPIFGMMICNDRRWAEAWRMHGLQGVELVLCGYNTAAWAPHLWGGRKKMTPEESEKEVLFHHKIVMQANSYMNSCFSVCAARAGMDDGKYGLIGGSCIIDSEGYIIAEAQGTGDEVVVAEIDLDEAKQGKEKTFNFIKHRRIETYDLIGSQTGVVEPELLE